MEKYVVLGRISALFGVKGWVKVFSHTRKREDILKYKKWYLKQSGKWVEAEVLHGQRHSKTVVVQIKGYEDRDISAQLINCDIAVKRDELNGLKPDEYYWFDLEGLEVKCIDGTLLGKIDSLFETGANDVMVVKGDKERLVPFIQGQVIKNIDLEAGEMLVDWDPEF